MRFIAVLLVLYVSPGCQSQCVNCVPQPTYQAAPCCVPTSNVQTIQTARTFTNGVQGGSQVVMYYNGQRIVSNGQQNTADVSGFNQNPANNYQNPGPVPVGGTINGVYQNPSNNQGQYNNNQYLSNQQPTNLNGGVMEQQQGGPVVGGNVDYTQQNQQGGANVGGNVGQNGQQQQVGNGAAPNNQFNEPYGDQSIGQGVSPSTNGGSTLAPSGEVGYQPFVPSGNTQYNNNGNNQGVQGSQPYQANDQSVIYPSTSIGAGVAPGAVAGSSYNAPNAAYVDSQPQTYPTQVVTGGAVQNQNVQQQPGLNNQYQDQANYAGAQNGNQQNAAQGGMNATPQPGNQNQYQNQNQNQNSNQNPNQNQYQNQNQNPTQQGYTSSGQFAGQGQSTTSSPQYQDQTTNQQQQQQQQQQQYTTNSGAQQQQGYTQSPNSPSPVTYTQSLNGFSTVTPTPSPQLQNDPNNQVFVPFNNGNVENENLSTTPNQQPINPSTTPSPQQSNGNVYVPVQNDQNYQNQNADGQFTSSPSTYQPENAATAPTATYQNSPSTISPPISSTPSSQTPVIYPVPLPSEQTSTNAPNQQLYNDQSQSQNLNPTQTPTQFSTQYPTQNPTQAPSQTFEQNHDQSQNQFQNQNQNENQFENQGSSSTQSFEGLNTTPSQIPNLESTTPTSNDFAGYQTTSFPNQQQNQGSSSTSGPYVVGVPQGQGQSSTVNPNFQSSTPMYNDNNNYNNGNNINGQQFDQSSTPANGATNAFETTPTGIYSTNDNSNGMFSSTANPNMPQAQYPSQEQLLSANGQSSSISSTPAPQYPSQEQYVTSQNNGASTQQNFNNGAGTTSAQFPSQQELGQGTTQQGFVQNSDGSFATSPSSVSAQYPSQQDILMREQQNNGGTGSANTAAFTPVYNDMNTEYGHYSTSTMAAANSPQFDQPPANQQQNSAGKHMITVISTLLISLLL